MPTLSYLDLPGLSARESASRGFALALSGVGERLGLDPNYLAAVMSLESGFKPDAVNPKGGATGLIQFMPATATLLGTTASALRQMTAIQQLPFVEAFYRKAGQSIRKNTPGDYYMATFMPAFVGAPPVHRAGLEGATHLRPKRRPRPKPRRRADGLRRVGRHQRARGRSAVEADAFDRSRRRRKKSAPGASPAGALLAVGVAAAIFWATLRIKPGSSGARVARTWPASS